MSLEHSEDKFENKLSPVTVKPCCLGQVQVSLLLIQSTLLRILFHNRSLVTFIFKIHLSSADQKLSRVE